MQPAAVAITGLGVKTPAGNDPETMWRTLSAGRSCCDLIRAFDPAGLAVRMAAEVRDFDVRDYLGAKAARQVDRATQLGFAAAVDAVTDAAAGSAYRVDRCSIIVGTGMGGTSSYLAQVKTFLGEGPDRLSPRSIPMVMPNATGALVAAELGWTGPNLCIGTACAAGANAIGEGFRLLRDGSVDLVLAGGCEAPITPLIIAGFARMGALSMRNDMPSAASRPFDTDRDGFVLAEGAAFVVLESLDRARARGARIHGLVAGYGRTCDAYHLAMPEPNGRGAIACMQLALHDAGLRPGDIGHINAHGTSTLLNDAAEARAITAVFGPTVPPVTSTKGATGHLIGAAGAVETVASVLAMRHGTVAPTANVVSVDTAIELDVVAGAARVARPGPVLTNSFAFGGHNVSLVLAPVDGFAGRSDRP